MSNITTEILSRQVMDSIPRYYVCLWKCSSNILASSDSTALIEMEIPATEITYNNIPNTEFGSGGACYSMQLLSISVSSNSADFNFRLLNKDDINLLDSIYEVYRYNNISSVMIDQDFRTYIINNRDTTKTNKLYAYIENNDTNATGDIYIEMKYMVMDHRA
jgi:hypothetical protein